MCIRDRPSPAPTPASTTPAAAAAAEPTLSGQVLIVAAPFKSFVALNQFQDSIRAVPGVRSTHVRRFYLGTLTMVVEYDGGVPFIDRLQTASDGAWQIVATEPNRLDVAIEARRPARKRSG